MLVTGAERGPSSMKLLAIIRKGAPLLAAPLSLAMHYSNATPPVWIFLAGLIAIAVLADWVRRGTEQVAMHAGATIGSLLNVSFGNAAELALALFVLSQAQTQVVQAQITGSIIGATLLFLGVSALAGGLRHERQTFSQAQVGLLSTLLLLVAIAILLPAVFDITERALSPGADRAVPDERLSIGVSVVLLPLYFAYLIYVLVTHRDMFAMGAERGRREWSLPLGLAVMICGTLVIAVESEVVATRLGETASALGLSPVFMGVVVIALVGTIAESVCLSGVRARRPDGHCARHVRRFGIADRARDRARARSGVARDRPPDDFGVRQSARSVRHRQRRVHGADDRRRRRDDVVRRHAADRGLRPLCTGLLLPGRRAGESTERVMRRCRRRGRFRPRRRLCVACARSLWLCRF